MTRLKAFCIHLSCSIVIALLSLLIIFRIWYPPPLALATGVSAIVLMVIAVDMVLGPLLTLLVFKPGKPSLKFDMSVIVMVQIAALAYGLWTVAVARPAWIVFNADRFDLVQAHHLYRPDSDPIQPQYQHVSWWGPGLTAAVLPMDPDARMNILMQAAAFGADVAQRPAYYVELGSQASAMSKYARPVSELERFNPPGTVEETLRDYPSADCWLPLKAEKLSMVMLVTCSGEEVIGAVDLRPWEPLPAPAATE